MCATKLCKFSMHVCNQIELQFLAHTAVQCLWDRATKFQRQIAHRALRAIDKTVDSDPTPSQRTVQCRVASVSSGFSELCTHSQLYILFGGSPWEGRAAGDTQHLYTHRRHAACAPPEHGAVHGRAQVVEADACVFTGGVGAFCHHRQRGKWVR